MDQINIFDMLFPKYKIKKPVRLIENFAGIGSQSKALKRLQKEFDFEFEHYRVVEFDKYAVKSYNAIHGTNFETSDITKINAKDLGIVNTDKYDYIMTYSFPCQDLSLAGNRKGMKKGSNTRSGLLWEIERLLDEIVEVGGELPQVLLMENVPQVISSVNMNDFHLWQKKLEDLGYSNYVSLLNSKNYGIPQNRNRCFMVSILGQYNYSFPKSFELELRLKDMLEDSVDEKYYLSDEQLTRINSNFDDKSIIDETEEYGVIDFRYDDGIRTRVDKGVCPTIATKCGSPGLSGQPLVKLFGNVNPSGRGMNGNVYPGDIAPTLTTNKGEGLKILTGGVMIPEATKKGYAIAYEGDSVNLAYFDSETRRGRVGKQCSQTLLCNDNNGVVEKNLRIRKLTPLECWRLMGFEDVDFYKASKVNSNAQLYKQAGNSIVVDVLYYIFREFFI